MTVTGLSCDVSKRELTLSILYKNQSIQPVWATGFISDRRQSVDMLKSRAQGPVFLDLPAVTD